MESVGARLKKIRLEKGISLEDIQKKTKVHLNILKAIEEDSLVNFSPVYIRGFLKLYCNFLGLNPKDFIPDYKETEKAVKTTAELPTPSAPLKSSRFKPRIKIKAVFIAILILLFMAGLFNLGKKISSRRAYLPRQAKSRRTLPSKTVTKAQVPPQSQQATKPSPVVASKIKKDKTDFSTEFNQPIRLGIRAREDCFLHLKVDGRTMFQGTLKRGRYEVWEALKSIEFSLGNAAGVDLELNSKPIANLGRRKQAIKNIIVTREEGLVIPR